MRSPPRATACGSAELALDGPQAAAELLGDLVVAVALHLEQGDRAELLVAEALEQAATFVDHLGGECGSRLPADDLLQPPTRLGARRVEGRLADHPPAAAALAALPPEVVGGLARRDRHEQPPQVAAVAEPGEPALGGTPAEAVEGAQRHVLLVGHAQRGRLEPGVRQADELVEVSPPELRGGVINLGAAQGVDQPGDGAFRVGCHRGRPGFVRVRALSLDAAEDFTPERLAGHQKCGPGRPRNRAGTVAGSMAAPGLMRGG